jgi:hypothetical protein
VSLPWKKSVDAADAYETGINGAKKATISVAEQTFMANLCRKRLPMQRFYM